uniref:Uncharacterized protein n=1 Tax=Timema shepardi TaxID=629360 RepID=A0A7R9B4E8_TIMSH|nr:unnamed protein product [Timema shepardi]
MASLVLTDSSQLTSDSQHLALEVTILRVPESRFADVLDHATPIFLRDEPLSRCFQPCTTGRRERAFSLMAVESTPGVTQQDGRIVGVSLNISFTKSDTNYSEQVDTGLATQLVRSSPKLGETPGGILSRMCFQGWQHEWSEVARSWERPQVVFYRGWLATQLVRSSLELGAGLGFRAAKADSTGPVSANVGRRAGLQTVFTLPYKDYKVANKVVFEGASGGLTVLAARLRNIPPYVLPVSGDKSQL